MLREDLGSGRHRGPSEARQEAMETPASKPSPFVRKLQARELRDLPKVAETALHLSTEPLTPCPATILPHAGLYPQETPGPTLALDNRPESCSFLFFKPLRQITKENIKSL